MSADLIDRIAAALPAPVQRRETHTAWVLIAGDRVVKLRKPVRLPFVDYATPARRQAAARAEVEANRELAPGLYRGVLSVVESEDGSVQLVAGMREDATDFAVEMRRFDEARTLQSRLLDGRLTGRQLDRTAERIAAYHAAAPGLAVDGCARFAARVHDDLDDLGEPADGPRRRYVRAALRRRGAELDARARAGLVRDGHGDLRAEHVVLDGPPLIVDRLEFDPGLRACDTGSDLAFLTMDLERLGAPAAARRLVRAYRRAGGRPASPSLQALFAWQRVLVRVKVARLTGDDRAGAALEALEAAFAWRERLTEVVIVAGPPASGKSTLASLLGRATGRSVVSTDVVRKALHGVAATARLGPAAYSDAATCAVYDEVGRRAAAEIAYRDGVIIDATARSPSLRHRLLAHLDGAEPPLVLVCEAPVAVLVARAGHRVAAGGQVSDAGPAVVAAIATSFEPPVVGETGLGAVVAVPTADEDPLAEAARRLDALG